MVILNVHPVLEFSSRAAAFHLIFPFSSRKKNTGKNRKHFFFKLSTTTSFRKALSRPNIFRKHLLFGCSIRQTSLGKKRIERPRKTITPLGSLGVLFRHTAMPQLSSPPPVVKRKRIFSRKCYVQDVSGLLYVVTFFVSSTMA